MAKRRRRQPRDREERYVEYRDWDFPQYVPAAERKARADRTLEKLKKAGRNPSPVVISGRAISATFWGRAWCDNLERYSDYANRLPRGRTYVRGGSVLDLQVGPGRVDALVSGTDVYTVAVKVARVGAQRWRAICARCSGAIDSLVELLQGRFSTAVMEHLCAQGTGLFPTPSEIEFTCSCPDRALLCKHVAAVLYGVGARLDERPELLFRLRQVNEEELIARSTTDLPLSSKRPPVGRVLEDADLAALFGVELGDATTPPEAKRARPRTTPSSRRASGRRASGED